MELAPTSRHDSKTDRIGARVGLWDTALKFLSPDPRNDVTDHLALFQILEAVGSVHGSANPCFKFSVPC